MKLPLIGWLSRSPCWGVKAIAMMRLTPLVLSLSLAACAHMPSRETAQLGRWGGKGLELNINEDAGAIQRRLTFSCGWGSIDEPIIANGKGQWQAKGSYTQGSGTPPPEPPSAVPAIYWGTLKGDSLHIWGKTAAGDLITNIELRRDREPEIYFCPSAPPQQSQQQ